MRDLSTINISDIHVFNNINPTVYIIDHLLKWLIYHLAIIIKASIFFISGDFFHKGVNYNSPDIKHVLRGIEAIGRICLENGICLRILEGTRSHDMDQNKNLLVHLKSRFPDLDVKLFTTISHEHIEHLDAHILYVPDNMGPASKVLTEVHRVLRQAGVEQVDIACMHGMFEYMHSIANGIETHDSYSYLRIVKHYITIGHYHKRTVDRTGRIQGQGSLDRISHGEEEPKGGICMQIADGEEPISMFLENIYATKFLAVPLVGDSKTDEKLIRDASVSPPDEIINLRLVGTAQNPFISNSRALSPIYPHVTFTVERTLSEKEEENKTVQVVYEDIPVITKNNLPAVFRTFLEDKGADDIDSLMIGLDDVLNDKVI